MKLMIKIWSIGMEYRGGVDKFRNGCWVVGKVYLLCVGGKVFEVVFERYSI